MAGERLPDFNEPGAPAPVVDPSVGTNPSSAGQSAAPQQGASAQDAGAPAAPAGSPAEGAAQPAPASPPAQPPAAPAPQPSAEGQQPPPEAPPEGQPPAAEAQPPPGEEEPELTEEEYQQFRSRLHGELKEELQEDYEGRLQQSRADQARATEAVQRELAAERARVDSVTAELREVQIKGLPEAEQAKLRASWDLEDKTRAVDAYRTEVEGYHDDVDLVRLLTEYAEFGVTEDELKALPIDERELHCEQKRAEHWEKQAKAKGQPGTDGQTQPPAQPSPPQRPVPAGAHAPSDTGGGGAPEPPPQPNTEQGPAAMADNIGRRDSWQPPTFDVTRRG